MTPTFDNIEEIITKMPIDSKTKQKLIESSKTMVEFRDHLCKADNITKEQAEKQIKDVTTKGFTGSVESINASIVHFAKQKQFKNADKLEESLNFFKNGATGI